MQGESPHSNQDSHFPAVAICKLSKGETRFRNCSSASNYLIYIKKAHNHIKTVMLLAQETHRDSGGGEHLKHSFETDSARGFHHITT